MRAIALILVLLPFVHPAPVPTIPYPPPAELTMGDVDANITILAGGGIPSVATASVHTDYSAAGITTLQLLASLENIEAFYYAEFIHNVTSGVYTMPDDLVMNNTIEVVSKIAAQEAVHVATTGAILRLNSAPVVPPCNYSFPVTNFEEFLAVANLLTSANFGSVIGAQLQLSGDDLALAPGITSILGAETRHDAFLRILHGGASAVPNSSPFDTGLPSAWAYNIGLQLTVPGSCEVEVPLPSYPRLAMDLGETAAWASSTYPETITFGWDAQQAWVARETGKQLYAAWVNLFNQPVYTNVTVSKAGSGTAPVPKDMQAVAYVALTTLQPSNFADLQDATLVGPLALAMS